MMKKLFAWIVFWSVIHFLRTGELYDIWGQFVSGAINKGILPVAWFLFTYCILLILGYPLYYFCRKFPAAFLVLSFVWMTALAMGLGESIVIVKSGTPALWIHLYLGYFCLGMVGYGVKKKLGSVRVKRIIVIVIFINLCCAAFYVWSVKTAEVYLPPHRYYGKWFYTIWMVSLFWAVTWIPVKNERLRQVVSRLASNTFVVYLGHLPILLYITAIYPIQNTGTAVLFVTAFFIGLEAVAELFRKLPLLRKLI